jgi:hypothetical protein
MLTVTPEDRTMNTPSPAVTRPQRLYANTVLTLIACIMLAMMLDRGQGSLISLASAQPRQPQATTPRGGDDGDESGRVSAAEQRKVMIAELRNLSTRMEHIEAVLNKPLTVKVSEMPPIQFPSDKGDKSDKKDDHKADKKQQ